MKLIGQSSRRARRTLVERLSPGFRDVVVAARCVAAARMGDHDANYVGGDISVGGNSTVHSPAPPHG